MILTTEWMLLLALVGAFVITYLSIPTLVKVAKAKNLFDIPGIRKSHTSNIPTLGGVAIFAGLLITVTLLIDTNSILEFKYIIAALTIVFFIGIKDDILVIAPNKKLFGEILAALVLVLLADLRITDLHGFFGIREIPYVVSVLLTLFVIIVILNGLNLIDGIDGLASGVGILASITFGVCFYLAGEYQYTILAVGLIGALAAFMRFNVYQGNYKIFMGDTGSLIIGLFLSVFAIKFNQINVYSNTNDFSLYSSPAVSFGILIVPLFDTLRVFVIRLARGNSPFSADKNHVHHRLLRLGHSHLGATSRILLINTAFIAFVFVFDGMGILDLMLIILTVATVLSYLPSIILRNTKPRQIYDPESLPKVKIKFDYSQPEEYPREPVVKAKEKESISV